MMRATAARRIRFKRRLDDDELERRVRAEASWSSRLIGDNGVGLFGWGGGLQRRRRVVHKILAGDRDGDDSGARRLIAGDWDPPGDGIA